VGARPLPAGLVGAALALTTPVAAFAEDPARWRRGAVPPSGVTGATFLGGRLFVVGGTDLMRVWSIDVRTGSRRLEVERRIAGESEGLAAVSAFGGTLQWSVLPYDARKRRPTYGGGRGALLSLAAPR